MAAALQDAPIAVASRRRFPLSLSGRLGLFLIATVLALVILGPWLWQVDPESQSLMRASQGPSGAHPLGTDPQGRDMLARVIIGGTTSLLIGFGSMGIGLVAGTMIGVVTGLTDGIVRAACLRLIDAMLAVPGIVQAVIFVAVLGQGTGPLIVALGIYSTPIFARVAYAATRHVRNENYFLAATVLGAGPVRMVLRHVLPNITTPLITIATLRVGSNILTAAALNFFGLGVQPPAPEWGLMIAEARAYSWDQPWLLFAPGICLFVASLGFSLLGDGLRDWLDPKSRGTI
jgi:ABC-type dipeptide/oligopeptide/nickel transport system permease subunit